MIHLKAVEGCKVRDPQTKQEMSPDGVKLEKLDSFWFKRLKDGEVRLVEAPKISKSDKKDKGDK